MPDFSPITFARRLAALRADRKITQADLAAAVGVSQSSIGNWEDQRSPTEPVLSGIRSLAQFFGCTADYLCGLSDHPQALRPGDWLVDMVVLDAVMAGQPVAAGEGLAVPIPSRFRVVDSAEYARIQSRAREATNQPRRKKRP